MGHALVVGGARASVPSAGILAGDLAVGSSVYLMENGVAVEYLVVNQGIPSGSSLYDASCDGTWLLRKDCFQKKAWHSSNVNDYSKSTIHSYLNSDFLNLFDSIARSSIQQVKIPYRDGSGYGRTINSGENGLSTKIFLLSSKEVGFNIQTNVAPINEGVELDYFSGCISDNSASEKKRFAELNGSTVNWWLRSPFCNPSNSDPNEHSALAVNTNGMYVYYFCSYSPIAVRPALVLPSTALFDKNTLILKGVA